MAPAAEPELIKALNGTDPDYAKAGEAFKDKTNLAIVADTLGLLSRPGGRDAILNALPTADTDTTKTEFAQALVQFPSDPRVEPAFLAAYNKLTWNSSVELLGALKPRAALAQASASFYDSALTDWLVKETRAAPDAASKLLPIEAALKLMPPTKKAAVGAALQKAKSELPGDVFQASKQMFDYASQALDKCGTGPSCYLGVLDEPIPSSPDDRQLARREVGVDGGHLRPERAPTRRAPSCSSVSTRSRTRARASRVVEAIDRLAPKGDTAAADALDKIVASDTKAGDKGVLMADDSVVKIALRLRARAAP